MVKKDLAALVAQFAPSYHMVTKNGQSFNRAQSVAMLQQLVNGSTSGVTLSYTKVSTRILSLTWRGKEAIVTAEATAMGTAQAGGRTFRLQQVNAARDYWISTAQGWKIRQSIETKSNVWMDDRRVS